MPICKHVNVQETLEDIRDPPVQHRQNMQLPQFANLNGWSAGKMLLRRGPQVANRSAAEDLSITTVDAAVVPAPAGRNLGATWANVLGEKARSGGFTSFSLQRQPGLSSPAWTASLDVPQDLWSLSRFLLLVRRPTSLSFPALILLSYWLCPLTLTIQTETPRLAYRAPKQTASLYWTSEPQLNRTLWFGHCAPNAYSLFWLCRGWMNSTVESEQAQPLPFQSCGLRRKRTPTCPRHYSIYWHLLSREHWDKP